jgi:hypothetical protein
MNLNKKLAVAVSGAVLLMAGQFASADSTTDIVDALVSKGVLTEEEGKLISKGAKSQKEATDKANKSRVSVGSFIDNAQMYGDVRLRYEDRSGNGVPGATPVASTDESRLRARYKLTFGAKTTSGKWYSDVAFAMGANGRSDNATFGKSATANINDKETLYVKRAMIGYNATDWLKLEGGRLENPLYTTPMVWDADLTWEGLVEKANFKLGNADIFLTAAQTQYQGDRKNYDATTADTITTEMFAFQAGVKAALADNLTGKAALTYTNYSHNTAAGKPFKPGYGTDGTGQTAVTGVPGDSSHNYVAAVTGYTGYGLQAYGVNNLNQIEIPAELNYMASSNIGVRLYGDYTWNTDADARARNSGLTEAANGSSGSDDAAWLLGLVVGSAKDAKAFEGNKLAAGDWQARIWYQNVGVWAVDPNAVDSDFMDSRVNMKGTVFKAQYNIEDNLYANFAYGHATRKNKLYGAAGAAADINLNLNDFDLVQMDLTYKF